MPPVVFLGPTLPIAQARELLPEGIFLPPAEQGDIISCIRNYQPDAVGLIDGYFSHTLSVWHKEILEALDQGVPIYGSSSMGALRAAETWMYGMRGVGSVFEMFKRGDLEDDDEVALLHAEAEDGYKALTLPMVNVRETLAKAAAEGILDSDWLPQCIKLCKEIFYADRTIPAIALTLAGSGIPEQVAHAAVKALKDGYVDLKAHDARALLAAVANAAIVPAQPPGAYRSYLLEALWDRDALASTSTATVRNADIAETAALRHSRFTDVAFHALNRHVTALFAQFLGVKVTEDDRASEKDRLAKRFGLASAVSWDEWLTQNNLTENELRELLAELAMCRAMHRWQMSAHYIKANTRLLLNELRLRGEYPHWLSVAALESAALDPGFVDSALSDTTPLLELFYEHRLAVGLPIETDLDSWREESGFQTWDDVRIALLRARNLRETVNRARDVLAGIKDTAHSPDA